MDTSQKKESWNFFRTIVIKILLEDYLLVDVVKEVQDEIQLDAEQFVINKCKRVYSQLLMTGPFRKVIR